MLCYHTLFETGSKNRVCGTTYAYRFILIFLTKHSITSSYLFTAGHMDSSWSWFRHQFIDKSDISESSSRHDVIIPSSSTVRVKFFGSQAVIKIRNCFTPVYFSSTQNLGIPKRGTCHPHVGISAELSKLNYSWVIYNLISCMITDSLKCLAPSNGWCDTHVKLIVGLQNVYTFDLAKQIGYNWPELLFQSYLLEIHQSYFAMYVRFNDLRCNPTGWKYSWNWI